MSQALWTAVDEFINENLAGNDEAAPVWQCRWVHCGFSSVHRRCHLMTNLA